MKCSIRLSEDEKRCLKRLNARRGAAMTEYIITGILIGVFSIGTVSVFGDNLRALFSSADNSLTGDDSEPATKLGKGESYNLKGLKNAAGAGEEAGRLAAMNAALRTTLNDPNAKVIRDSDFVPRDPDDHPLYPGHRLPGYTVEKAGLVTGTAVTIGAVIAGTALLTDYLMTKWAYSLSKEKVHELEAKLESARNPTPPKKSPPGVVRLKGTLTPKDNAPFGSRATIEFDPGGYTAVADSNGRFTVPNFVPGTYEITLRQNGYYRTLLPKTINGDTVDLVVGWE